MHKHKIDRCCIEHYPKFVTQITVAHTYLIELYFSSDGESRKATRAAASNVDLYHVNCTYYDALAKNDLNYLFARAIQFFSPGVPQVYYGGLLAMTNDMALLARSNVGRDINHPYLDQKTRLEAVICSIYSVTMNRTNTHFCYWVVTWINMFG